MHSRVLLASSPFGGLVSGQYRHLSWKYLVHFVDLCHQTHHLDGGYTWRKQGCCGDEGSLMSAWKPFPRLALCVHETWEGCLLIELGAAHYYHPSYTSPGSTCLPCVHWWCCMPQLFLPEDQTSQFRLMDLFFQRATSRRYYLHLSICQKHDCYRISHQLSFMVMKSFWCSHALFKIANKFISSCWKNWAEWCQMETVHTMIVVPPKLNFT
mgnify:CR=1 FL=1